jgi:hypothetical protein
MSAVVIKALRHAHVDIDACIASIEAGGNGDTCDGLRQTLGLINEALAVLGAAVPSPAFVHIMSKPAACDHDFQGWRTSPSGNRGEQVCTKCGMGAMAYSLATRSLT